MPYPPVDPPVADLAPNTEGLTTYDQEHLVTYLRLLDAEADGANWTDAAQIILKIELQAGGSRGFHIGLGRIWR